MASGRGQNSIFGLMLLVAIAGLSLAFVQALPRDALIIPTFWIVLGVLDFVAIWKLVLRRPLRASHHIFLIAFVTGSFVLMTQAAMERFLPLTLLVRMSGHREWIPARILPLPWFGDLWAAVGVAFLLALACGALAGWLERRRGWDIAAVCRGTLLGFGIGALFGVIQHATLGPEQESILANWIVLALGVMFFGGLARGWFRSSHLASGGRPVAVTPPSGD